MGTLSVGIKQARTEIGYLSSHNVEARRDGAVPPLPTRVVVWCLIEHVANFNFINTSAISAIRTTVLTNNTTTNIGFAVIGEVIQYEAPSGVSKLCYIATSPLTYILPRIV